MNKIYSLILSLALFAAVLENSMVQAYGEDFPELLPVGVDIQKMMNIKAPNNGVEKATAQTLIDISTPNLDPDSLEKMKKHDEAVAKAEAKAKAKQAKIDAEYQKKAQRAARKQEELLKKQVQKAELEKLKAFEKNAQDVEENNKAAEAKKQRELQKQAELQQKQIEAEKQAELQKLEKLKEAKKLADEKKLQEVHEQKLKQTTVSEKSLKKVQDTEKQAVENEKKTKAAVNKKKDKAVKKQESDEIQAVEEKKLTREQKRIQKKKEEYKDYYIQTDGYMPVGNKQDRIQGSVQKTLEFNLADCLELALINNPKVKSAYAQASAQRAVKNQTLSNYSPRVNINAGISRMKPDTSGFRGISSDSYTKYLLGTIGVSQLVYDFGFTQNQYTIDKLAYQTAKVNIESVVNDVICNVKDNYYALLFAIAKKQVAIDTVAQYEQMYNQARAFYQVGTKPKVDVTIAASNLADAKSNLIEATNDVDIAISRLNNAMGLPFAPPYVVDTEIPFQEVDLSMKEAVAIANDNRPDLKMSLLQMEQANQYVKLAKKTYMPSLEFKGNWSMGGREDLTETTWYDAGGYLTFPVINPFLIKNEISQAKALYEQQRYDTKANVNDIYYEIQQAYVLLTDARDRIPSAKWFVKEAKESYELSSGRYRVGVCDAIELRDAQVQYANAKLSYINTLYKYNSAKAKLEKAIGKSIGADISEYSEM